MLASLELVWNLYFSEFVPSVLLLYRTQNANNTANCPGGELKSVQIKMGFLRSSHPILKTCVFHVFFPMIKAHLCNDGAA